MQGFACCEHLNRNPNSVVTGACGCVLFNFLWIREGKSKPAPFADKKNAKNAAPANSIRAFNRREVCS